MRRHMKLHTPSANLLQCSSVSNLQCSFQTTRFDKLRSHLAKKHSIDHPTTATFAAKKQISASPIVTGFGHKQQEGLVDGQPDLCVEQMDGSAVTGLDSKVCEDRVVMVGDVPQNDFSVLVVSPEIVELADIEGLGDTHTDAHTHTQMHTGGGKQGETENVSGLSEAHRFTTDFLVNHELLLDKADGMDGQVEGTLHPLPPDLLGGKMEAVEGGVMPYEPEPCVLEVMEEEEEEVMEEERKNESERVREREREQEREREKQCIDSLNILEFMLDNVAN
ncbi:hypothetical protein E2C01_071434 [Portunus trituberculatus]|uniref:Uncharacterized protein n=1 Tax=Portunus trituberculatus TaxID=210409 RepID=A0A5B7I679_PORTR|nr:hypothetical protein [Portunus trituberculatus]